MSITGFQPEKYESVDIFSFIKLIIILTTLNERGWRSKNTVFI